MIAIVNPMHEQREILKRRGIRKKKEIVVSHILESFFNGGKRGKYQNSY